MLRTENGKTKTFPPNSSFSREPNRTQLRSTINSQTQTHSQTLLPVSFLISSLRLFLLRAQTAMLVPPSPSDLVSAKSGIISILMTRSEKLLSLKANAKSESDPDPHASPPVEKSESMIVRGSKRSAFDSPMPKPWKKPPRWENTLRNKNPSLQRSSFR